MLTEEETSSFLDENVVNPNEQTEEDNSACRSWKLSYLIFSSVLMISAAVITGLFIAEYMLSNEVCEEMGKIMQGTAKGVQGEKFSVVGCYEDSSWGFNPTGGLFVGFTLAVLVGGHIFFLGFLMFVISCFTHVDAPILMAPIHTPILIFIIIFKRSDAHLFYNAFFSKFVAQMDQIYLCGPCHFWSRPLFYVQSH